MQEMVYAEWGWREYHDVAQCFIRGATNQGHHTADMLAKFGEFFPRSTLFPVNRGRVALGLALRAFAKLEPRKRRVVYPAYVCHSVFEAIEDAGLVPVPADVGSDLNLGVKEADAAVTADTLAVIAVHAYGCPAPLDQLAGICRRRGSFLIDDAANVVGVSVGGRMLGGGGDVGLISFTGSKSVVAGGFNAGGLLLVNNSELARPMQQEWETLPRPRYRASDFLLFMRDLQLEPYTEHATYYYYALRRRVFGEIGRHSCPAARMPNVSAAVAMRQLHSLPNRIAGRTRVSETFQRHLASIPDIRFPQYAPGRYLSRILVQLPEGSDREMVRMFLKRRGIATRRGYVLGFRHGSGFPQIAEVAPRLLELPSHSQMQEPAVVEICAALHESLKTRKAESIAGEARGAPLVPDRPSAERG